MQDCEDCEGDAGDIPRAEAEHGAGGPAVQRLIPGLQEAGICEVPPPACLPSYSKN